MAPHVTTPSLTSWRNRHPQAAAELAAILMPPPPAETGASESRVQSLCRLEAARIGGRLDRNNRGAYQDPNTGRWIRYGLMNDSDALDKVIKSGDLVGWYPLIIGPQHIGTVVAQYWNVEVKQPGWHLTPGDKRGQAQARCCELVIAAGGRAGFCTDAAQLGVTV